MTRESEVEGEWIKGHIKGKDKRKKEFNLKEFIHELRMKLYNLYWLESPVNYWMVEKIINDLEKKYLK